MPLWKETQETVSRTWYFGGFSAKIIKDFCDSFRNGNEPWVKPIPKQIKPYNVHPVTVAFHENRAEKY